MENVDFLQTVVLFSGLGKKDLEEIAKLFTQKFYPRGAVIFFQSEKGDNFYIVKSGSIKVYRLTEDGREIILDVFTVGDFFGEMALLDGNHRSATAQAREPTVLLAMNSVVFQELIWNQPEIALKIISTLSRRLRHANTMIEDFAFRDAHDRIIHAVVKLAKTHSKDQGKLEVGLRLTHQELASLAGTSRETATRILLEMQSEGLVSLKQRYLIIHDLESLEKKLGNC